jgi:hypothetical protein
MIGFGMLTAPKPILSVLAIDRTAKMFGDLRA